MEKVVYSIGKEALSDMVEEVHQKYLNNLVLSSFQKICMVSVKSSYGWELTFTPYGRERYKVCDGGFYGCSGKGVMWDPKGETPPMCESCHKLLGMPMTTCHLCEDRYFKILGCNAYTVFENTPMGNVCPICAEVIQKVRDVIDKKQGKKDWSED